MTNYATNNHTRRSRKKKGHHDSSNDTVYSVFFLNFWFLVLAFGDLKINLSY